MIPRGDEQVQTTAATPVWQLNGQRPLPSAERGEVRDRPIEPRELQNARDGEAIAERSPDEAAGQREP